MQSLLRTFILLLFTVPALAQWVELESGTTETLWDISAPSGLVATATGAGGLILRTEDGGGTWTPQDAVTEVDYRAVSFVNDSVGLAAGTSGTIVFTMNRGEDWETIETGWMHPYHAAHQYSAQGGVVAGVNSIFQPIVGYTTNGWTDYDFLVFYPEHDHSSYEGTISDIYYFDAQIGVTAIRVFDGQGAICRTADGGDNWGTVHWNVNSLYAVDFWDEQFGCAVGGAGTILTTADGGQTWQQVTSPTGTELMDVSFGSPLQVWAVGFGGTIIHSDDGGQTWAPQANPVTEDLHGISMVSPDTGYACGANSTILFTSNGGVPPGNFPPGEFNRVSPEENSWWGPNQWPVLMSWTEAIDPDQDSVTYILHVWSTDSLYPQDVTYLVTSIDTVLEFPAPEISPWNYEVNWTVEATDGEDTTLASNGTGMFHIWIEVSADDIILHPSSLSLSVYPNPFNPTTTLRLSLPVPSEATLRVFDVTGRLVRDIGLGRLASGSHELSFDGSELPSGIYLAALETPTQRTTQKLVLMK